MTRRCNEAAAPVSKTVAITFDRNRRVRHKMVWTLQIRDAREVHVQHCDHRRCLWKFEGEFTPDVDTHDVSISSSAYGKVAAAVVGGAVENQQDVLPGKLGNGRGVSLRRPCRCRRL